jgi:hypothetical protein
MQILRRAPRRDIKGRGRFLKKAAQKLLLNWAGGAETSTAQMSKVFCTFLFTKSSLFLRFSGVGGGEAGTAFA